MNDLTVPKGSALDKFDPGKTRKVDAQADAVIEYAKRVKDWPALEQAVDVKIDQQVEFIRWWDENVGVNHGAGRGHKKNADPDSFSKDKAEELTGITQPQVSKWRRKVKDVEKYRAALYGVAYRAAMAAVAAHVSNSSGENEWYTPAEIIEAARRVMGGIDLDPASSALANETVGASVHYTAQDDGLKQRWSGRVWMNPPYAQPLCAQFCAAAGAEFSAGKIQQACVLINNATETAWFQGLLDFACAVCFLRGRVKFIDPEGSPSGSPLQGQAVIYMGPNAPAFAEEFGRMGTVLFHG